MSDPWEDFQPGATTATAPPDGAPWDDFKPIPLSEEAKADIVSTVKKNAQRQAALGQPFAEVQPGGNVTQRIPANDAEANQAEFTSVPGRLGQAAEKYGAEVLNYPVELWRADTGTPRQFSIKQDENGKTQLTMEDKPLPFQPNVPMYHGEPFANGDIDPVNSLLNKLASGMTTPGMLATLPAAEADLVKGYFLTQTVPGVVEGAAGAMDKSKDTKERVESGLSGALNGLFSYLLGLKGAKTPAEVAANELNASEPNVQPGAEGAQPAPVVESVSKNPWDDFKQAATVKESLTAEPPAIAPPETVAPEIGTETPVSETITPPIETKSPVDTLGEGIDFEKIQKPHLVGIEAGLNLTPDDVPALKARQKKVSDAMVTAAETGEDFQSLFGEATFLGGAIEAANKKGPNWDLYQKMQAQKSSPPPETPTTEPTAPQAEPAAEIIPPAAGEVRQPSSDELNRLSNAEIVPEMRPRRKSQATPPPIDKPAPEAQPTIEAQNETGQPQQSTPQVDVREPAGTGQITPPLEKTGTPPGTQEPASPGAGGQVQEGAPNVGGRGVSGGKRRSVSPAGRPGDVGTSPGASPVEGAGADNALPRSDSDLNHVLPTNEDFIPSGDKAKVRANLDAVKLLKKLETEQRNPTPEEKTVLAKYTGWGGLKEVFDTGKAAYRERPPWADDQKKEYANWEKSWGKLYDEVKGNLTDDEHDAAARSILNAHYTSREIINGVWKAVQQLGFKGGNALEPAAGVGHFIGLTPEALRGKTKWKAVELDSLSGRIAAKLYPESHVQNTGFQDAKIPNNSQDLVVSNFPFAADGPTDKRYPNFSLHNYFFARSLDLVKPGGIVAAITSDSTMDSAASRKAREFMAEKADLVGAIRLPNTAFKKNAGTEVTTDILFFRKRTAIPYDKAQDFVRTVPAETYKGEPININEYFVNHPDMMLGRMSKEGTMYRAEQQALLPTPGRDLNEQFAEAIKKLPEDAFGSKSAADVPMAKAETAVAGSKIGGLVIKDGVPYRVEGDGSMVKPDWAGTPAKVTQAKRYVEMRDTASKAIREMLDPNATDKDIEASRKQLNSLYDDYRKRHGAINERPSAFLDDDVDFPLALALEDANTKTVDTPKGPKRVTEWTKSKIFSERTLFPRNAPAKVDTVPDALQVSMNYAGKVDPDYMAQLTGRTPDSVKSELRSLGTAFENPATGHWETRSEYLSGFVKDKLKEAQKAAQDDPAMLKNVAELEKVQPAPIAMENIGFRLGSRWIPEKVIEDFIRDVLDVRANVSLTDQTGDWHVNAGDGVWGERNKTVYGIHDWKGHELVEAALNLKSPKVTRIEAKAGGGESEVKDGPKTLEAEAKQQELQNQFKKYVATHPEAANLMERIYNERHNGVVAPKFEPPTWEHYPGASTDITLREHQKSVVTRMLQNSTLLAHAVGTGKTYAMITAAMEMRRLGLAKKPMIVVQNATLEQFARSYKRLYPTARILVPNAKARDALNRNKTMSRIATGDWDSVIIPQSFVNMLPDDPVREEKWLQKQIDELEADKIEAARSAGKRSPKAADLQRAIGKLEDRLTALQDRKKDNVLNFEQLGVDALFVDEAHAYKKLQFNTKMDNIKGLDTGASQRGLSMMFKARWVQEKNQGRNVIFATGTPVSNTIAEAWTMMRYLRPDVLKKYHIEDFDSFAGTFGDTITGLEMTATGNWKPVTRFARYTNGPELISAWRTVADVVTPEEINLPGLPALKNGKPTQVTIPQTKNLTGYIKYLQSELERFAKMSGKEKRENSHIPLVVFGRAKKASLDMRMIDPNLPDEATSKLNVAADNITRIFKESEKSKGAQMVFSDSYQDNPDAPRFNLYTALKDKLIERGIPADQIAIITADIKDAKREALFQKVNDGDIRVVIGSTERMGVGVNAQEHLIGLHHLDAPPRPMDIEQRNGRILRQGNSNPVVEILNYGVENTLDAAMYQKLATKQKFINQILRGDISGRNFEDAANEQSLSFEEQMAAFSGDKRAMEKVGLENQVRQLQMLRSGHYEQVRKARDTINDLETRQIPYNQDQIKNADRKAAEFAQAFPSGFEPVIEAGKQVVKVKKDAVTLLDKIFKDKIDSAERTAKAAGKFGDYVSTVEPAFSINGKPVEIVATLRADEKGIRQPERSDVGWRFVGGNNWHTVKTGQGFFSSLTSDLEGIAREPKWQRESMVSKERNLTELKGFIQQPFEREGEMHSAASKLQSLNAELEAEGKATKPAEGEEPPQGIVSMGGLAPGDPLEPVGKAGGAGGDVYGVAQRIRERRAAADQVASIPKGKGISPEASVERGRQLLSYGADPERIMSDFEQTSRFSADDLAVVRAKGEEIAKAARAIEEKFGTDTNEFRLAFQALSDWDARVKKMQTEWHKSGQTQQGETDLFDGTFTGIARAYKEATGKDFTPGQAKKAKEIVAGIQKQLESVKKSFESLKAELDRQPSTLPPPPPEKIEPHVRLVADKLKKYFDRRASSALDRIKARRSEGRLFTGIDPTDIADYADYGAAKIFEKGIQGAEMTMDWAKEMKEEIGEFIAPHLQQIWDASLKQLVDGFKKAAVPQEIKQKVKLAVQQDAEAAAKKTPVTLEQLRDNLSHRPGGKWTPEQVAAIWKYAKAAYYDQGVTDFDEIRNRLATDLGFSVNDITRALGQTKEAKRLADDLWRKKQELRRIQDQAKQFVNTSDLPLYQKALSAIPKTLFALKVGFHGTVALGTHAPFVAFQPNFWKVYVQDFAKMYKMVGSPAFYEREAQDIVRRPNFILATRAGLVNDPFKVEDFNNPQLSEYLGGLTGMGNRGYFVLKILRQDMFDQMWNQLPETAQVPDVAKAIADGINHATGIVRGRAPRGANLALFAPRLEFSRVAWLAADPVKAMMSVADWKNATEAEKVFAINQAKEKAWVAGTLFGLLALNAGILAATGSKQQVNFSDPMRSDFLKFKINGMVFSYGNAMLSMARLPVRLYQIRQSNGGKLKNLIYPDEDTYSVLGEYARSQLSPFASLASTLWFKSDWENRPLPNSDRPVPKRLAQQGVKPYTWPEFWSEQVLPIPLEEAMREVWKNGLGMKPDQISSMRKALATIAVMSATGGRLTEDTHLQKPNQLSQ